MLWMNPSRSCPPFFHRPPRTLGNPMKTRRVVVATRKSELALAQCRQFLSALCERHHHLIIEELHVVTTGDKIVDRPLAEVGGKGLFLKEIEEKLLDGSADIAVHSMKDVPPDSRPAPVIAWIELRGDLRDAVSTTDGLAFLELGHAARPGTSPRRRGVQRELLWPDLVIVPIRGIGGTRIRQCHDGDPDAT